MSNTGEGYTTRVVTLDATVGQETLGYFQGTFEQMQALGLLEETEVSHMLGRLSAQQGLLDECRAIHKDPGFKPQNFDPLSADTFALVSDNIGTARKVLANRQQLENDIFYVQKKPEIRTADIPLLDQVITRVAADADTWPRDLPFKWNNIGFQILSQSSVVLDTASLRLLLSFQTGPEIHIPEVPQRDKTHLATTDLAIATLHDPRNRVHLESLAPEMVATHADTYGKWRQASAMLPDGVPTITARNMAKVSEARKREKAEQVAALDTELTHLITAHDEQPGVFHPKWTMLDKRAGLRPFCNKLLHESRSETGILAIATTQDAKRLTGVLYALEQLGCTPEQFETKMNRLIIDEHATNTVIQQVASELATLGAQPSAEWHPLENDLRFLQKHWPTVVEIVKSTWKPSVEQHTSTTQSAGAMDRALRFAVQTIDKITATNSS